MRKKKKNLAELPGLAVARLACAALDGKKAEDVVLLDVRGLCSFTDYFVIASGRSSRHVQGLAEAVDEVLGARRLKESGMEGWNEGQWILLDYDDVVVHVFYREARGFYDLEGLWHDAPRLATSDDGEAAVASAAGRP